jgi:isoleucyl-tRNA synthetase
MDYSQTVNLPKTDFPMKADLPKREPVMLAQWEKEKVYAAALQNREGREKFILHDGPPYANGHLHLGHALNKILKDIIVRCKTMAGFYAPYVPGWDCHGLPIELQLMKELKVTDKHKVDRQQFRQQAQAFAQKFVDIQREEFKRMGILGDWDHPYLTMAESYKKAIVATFQKLELEGYIYRGKKPVYWCTTDETALAEAEVEYETDPGPSIYVAFPLHAPPNFNEDAGGHGNDKKAVLWTSGSVSFVIWTTTPWTLPANRAIAVHPDETYVLFEDSQNAKKYIVAQKRLESFQAASGLTGRVLDETPGHTFKEAFAKHPWIENLYVPVLLASFVAMDTGTGLVHIAPGHGMEDYQLGIAHDLEVYSPVDDKGRFTDEVPAWKGLHVFKANPLILEFLKEKGVLLQSSEITHSYPHCWRCHRPVIFRATEQWFLNVDYNGLRGKLLEALNQVTFYPEFGKNRMTGMLNSRPDWCLSRQRLWGTEIPNTLSSPEVTGAGPLENDAKKDADIFDVWFESGVSWAAVLKNSKEWPGLSYPADMYLEGSDQHRGWFQTSLIPSVAAEGKAPFKSVLTHGFVMDGEGKPMSKSLGNVIAPEEIIKQYGADVLRLWVASSDYSNDVRLSPEILKGLSDNYRKVRNTLRYLLNNLTDFDPAKDSVSAGGLEEIDRWALHRLQEEIRDALTAYKNYQFHRVASRLVGFCGADLSSFYLDAAKDRLYCDPSRSPSRRAAQTVLYRVADALLRLWAPILSFTADESWRFLGHPQAIALSDLPAVEASLMDSPLMERWKTLLTVRESVLAEIEKARAAGLLKAPREAKVLLRLKENEQEIFFKNYGASLPLILGVSQVEVQQDAAVTGVAVTIQKTDGVKCARCWIYKKDIGSDSHAPDICGRCAQAVEAWKQTNPAWAAGAHG